MIQYGQLAPPSHVIAHVSDTHLLAGDALQYGAIDTVARFLPALERLTRIDPPPQALVFTGDLADRGEPEAYRALRELVEPYAGRIGAQVVWCMGNHDERPAYSAGAVRRGSPRRPRTGCTTSPGCGSSASTRPCRAGTTASSPTTSSPGWPIVLATPAEHGTILAMHHPPIPSPLVPAAEIIELLDTERLAAVLRGTDVRAILGGHYHFTSHSTFAGIPVSVAAATCYTVDTAPLDRLDLRRSTATRPSTSSTCTTTASSTRSCRSPSAPEVDGFGTDVAPCSRPSARRSGSTWCRARTRR